MPAPMRRPRLPVIVAWCLYDWAHAAFSTVILTFIFATYFTSAVAPSKDAGTVLWSQALIAAGLVVAVAAPVLGAVADQTGRRKPWIAAFLVLGLAATTTLYWVTPEPASVLPALIAVATAQACFELAAVFYNAQLVDVAPPGRTGLISGWGWGAGYVGGMVALLVALFGLIRADAWLPLPHAHMIHVRATALLVPVWFGLFALPLFALVPDRAGGSRGAVAHSLVHLGRTLRRAAADRSLLLFLVGSALYRDGLSTLFAFGGIYAAHTFGWGFDQLVVFAIALNLAAAAGAAVVAPLDDRLGPKAVIILSLIGLIGFGTAVLLISAAAWFWALAIGLGLFIGPAQSAGRTLVTRLARPVALAEMFGLYTLTGKTSAVLGPLLFGLATAHFHGERAGMATIVLLFLAGLALMTGVRVPAQDRAPAVADGLPAVGS